MAESRDRLSRAIDIAAVFSRRRSGILGIYEDQPDLASPATSRPNTLTPTVTGTGAVTRTRTVAGRGNFGTSRRNVYGRENTAVTGSIVRRGNRRSRGVVSNSVLPNWYPRTPLRDITAIVRAIERRRERLGEGRVQEIESPVLHAYRVPGSSEPSSVARLKHNNTIMSPIPSIQVKRCSSTLGKVPKFLLDIKNQASDDLEFLTPEKKLLNSIDTVEKEVMEELRKLESTPSARKAEREKKVRTLMSLR